MVLKKIRNLPCKNPIWYSEEKRIKHLQILVVNSKEHKSRMDDICQVYKMCCQAFQQSLLTPSIASILAIRLDLMYVPASGIKNLRWLYHHHRDKSWVKVENKFKPAICNLMQAANTFLKDNYIIEHLPQSVHWL